MAAHRAGALSELGRTPSFEEVASHLGLSETQKSLVAKGTLRPPAEARKSTEWGWAGDRWLGQTTTASPPSLARKPATSGTFCGAGWNGSTAATTILVLRYGLEGETPLTLKEIGRRLEVTVK